MPSPPPELSLYYPFNYPQLNNNLPNLLTLKHLLENLKVALISLIEDREPDLAEPATAAELGLLQDLEPAARHLPGRVVERAAAERAEHQQLVALERGDAQREAHLGLGQVAVGRVFEFVLLPSP